MTAKEYLNQPRELDRKINRKLKILESYKDLSQSISSTNYSERTSGSRNTSPPFAQYAEKIDELQREINDDIDRLVDLKAEINSLIEKLPDENEQLLLRYKYLMFMSIKDISIKMHYSKTWVKETTVQAVENFEKKVQEWLPLATCN